MKVTGIVPPYKVVVGEKPWYNAEDDLWYDAMNQRAYFADQHYGQSPEMWVGTVRHAVGHITDRKYVIDTGMPIVVTQSALRGKVVYGDLASLSSEDD